MNRPAHFRLVLVLSIALLALAACGGAEDDDTPLPTQVSLDDLATQRVQQVAPSAMPTTAPSVTPSPSAAPSEPPPTTTPVPTDTSIPSTPSHTPTLPPTSSPDGAALTAQADATGIALTNTAAAGVLPFTQTAEAVFGRTQTAAASLTPSVTPTTTFTPPPGPLEPYEIVFYSDRSGNDDIYLLALDGTEHRLTGSAANEREPSCAPDGRSLVYASDASGSWEIYWQPLDGTTPVQLTDSEGMNFAPAFSPDGSEIAFVSTRNNGIPTIWIMNADGSNPREITTTLGRDTTPSWSRDGRQLLFASEQFGPWDLFLTVLENDVEGEFPLMPPEFNDGNQLWPVFDPSGERIAYSTWSDLNDPQTADIYLLDFEQPAPVALSATGGADIAWDWGDDTHLIISLGGPGDVQIALLDVTTGDTVRLTDAGPFNGGARLCTVPRDILAPEPPLAPTPSPTKTPLPTLTPTPQPTPTVSAFSPQLLAAAGHKHIVQPGETLMKIGYTYGVNWVELIALNTLPDPDRISVGQTITVPVTTIARRVTGRLGHPDSDNTVRMATRKEIVVELDDQIVRAYEDGRLVKTMTVSTGLPKTPTVKGEYSIYYKIDAQTMSGPDYYLEGVPWVMYFYQGYGLHGTYWHDNFGEPMSHGCVNLRTPDAKWLYDWAQIGTPVLVRG